MTLWPRALAAVDSRARFGPLVLAAALLAPGAAQGQAPPVVTIVAHDFVFSLPEPRAVPAGPVTLRMINAGREMHMIMAVRLGEHSLPEYVAAVRAHSRPPWALALGGPNAVPAGDTSVTTVLLLPGHMALGCFVVSEDGTVHVLKGMVVPLEVLPARPAAAMEPRADASIRLRDYAIDLTGTVTAGPRTFRVENDGPARHDVQLFRMSPGATLADVDAWFEHPGQGSPRARPLGGMVGIDRGHHGFFGADLTPGDYLLVCWIPEKGVPHYGGHGMLRHFHVVRPLTHAGG